MKTLITFLFLGIIATGCSDSKSSSNTITGHIENNIEYRGGANPPEFLLNDLAIYKPSANQVFYVRSSANYAPFTTVIANFTTNPNGDFSIDLPSGSYAVICKDKYDFEQNVQATASCEYLAAPDFVLNITVNQQHYSSVFTNKRNNCTTFLPD